MRSYPHGFTLIEVVVSASLMALILVSGYLCLSSGLAGQKMVESRTDAIQSARVALGMITADLRAACPLSKEIEFLGMRRTLEDIDADNIDFATHHYQPRRAGEGDFCQVSYFIVKEPRSGKPSLWRRRNPTIGVDPLSGGKREEIVRDVRGLRFEYYDGIDWYDMWGDPTGRAKKQTSWREQPNLSGLPEAVRVTLWVEPSSRTSGRVPQAGETREPPLVFQTICRLNLAGAAAARPDGGAKDSSSSSTSNRPKTGTPEGENP